MALTPTEIDALPDYTNAQMVKLLRAALAELATNPDQATVEVAGRTWSQQNLTALRSTLAYFVDLAAQDADAAAATADFNGGAAPVVRFQEPPE
jgi:hypothetical protein